MVFFEHFLVLFGVLSAFAIVVGIRFLLGPPAPRAARAATAEPGHAVPAPGRHLRAAVIVSAADRGRVSAMISYRQLVGCSQVSEVEATVMHPDHARLWAMWLSARAARVTPFEHPTARVGPVNVHVVPRAAAAPGRRRFPVGTELGAPTERGLGAMVHRRQLVDFADVSEDEVTHVDPGRPKVLASISAPVTLRAKPRARRSMEEESAARVLLAAKQWFSSATLRDLVPPSFES